MFCGNEGKAGEAMAKRAGEYGGSCDSCVNFMFDEECQYYVCEANLDEDDMSRFLSGQNPGCAFYRLDDEYKVVRHQM